MVIFHSYVKLPEGNMAPWYGVMVDSVYEEIVQ